MYFTLFAVVTDGTLHLGKTSDFIPAAFRVHIHTFLLRSRARALKSFRVEVECSPI